MDVLAIVYSVLLAIAGTAAIIILPHIAGYRSRRRVLERFAKLQCGACETPFGLETVRSGKPIWIEELWSDGIDDFIHNHPECLLVECARCHHKWEIKYNTRGAEFGPELTVNEPHAAK